MLKSEQYTCMEKNNDKRVPKNNDKRVLKNNDKRGNILKIKFLQTYKNE